MKAPASITEAAHTRVRTCADEITHSLRAIAEGRPGDAETDETRRTAVVQVRRRVSFDEARRIAGNAGPEAVWGETIDFVDVAFLERGERAGRSVCRISTRAGQGIGTGFLISPRLLITNNHVIGSEAVARGMVAEFDYERDITGAPRESTRFALAPEQAFVTDDRDDLDFTVVALGQRVAGPKEIAAFGFLSLSGARNKHALGDIVNIIQHPDGRLKEAVVRENQLVSRPKSGTVLHYVADTEPGSSGSPVFNVMWDVIALHHWGGPHRELFDEKGLRVPRTVNEGVRISAIVLDLETRKTALAASARALVDEALKLGVDRLPVVRGTEVGGSQPYDRGGVAMTVAPDGTATWHIPLAVSVRLGGAPTGARGDPAAAAAPAPSPGLAAPSGEARIELDEHYHNRGGYDPAFLQSVTVPLPKLSAAQRRIAVKNNERRDGDDPHELKYEHFSAVMNGKRRLAFFTATNIDGSKAKDVNRDTGVITDASGPTEDEAEAAEAAELWFLDRRIEDDGQTPPDFYSGQTAFDVAGRRIVDKQTSGHRNQMFQQGHLTRRQDPLWGVDEVVTRAHADTFHVTNRAPQVGYFNMGVRKRGAEGRKHPGGTLYWRALEDYVLLNARADRKRVTVFTGPIFDEHNDIPWSRGRHDMKGFKAPREYWKLVLRVEDSLLHATALIADQSPLIGFVPEFLDVTDEEARRVSFEKVKKYHVSVAELERRTSLDFGPDVAAADTFNPGEGDEGNRRRIENVDEMSFDRRPDGPRAGTTRRRGAAP